MIQIDGSYLEGGGQLVRTAVTLAAITAKPFKIYNIRKKRKNPGLREQHLQAINSVSLLCSAKHNAVLYATEFEFKPREISRKQKLEIRVGTAGSTALIMSVIMPIAYSLDKEARIKINGGGTWNRFAPSVLYLKEVILPLIEKIGVKVEIEIKRNGFYPKGGGAIEFYLKPWKNKKQLILEDFNIKGAKIFSLASNYLKKRNVAERQADSAFEIINNNLDLAIEKEINYVNSFCPGSGILIKTFDTILGSDVVGEIGKRAEQVGKEAALNLIKEIAKKASVDRHAANQLMLYIALAGGKIKTSEISNHVKTNAYVIEKFLPVKFKFEKNCISLFH